MELPSEADLIQTVRYLTGVKKELSLKITGPDEYLAYSPGPG